MDVSKPGLVEDQKFAQDVKRNYDLVKAANSNNLGERDGVSFSLEDALLQTSQLFSYAYGDYEIKSDSTYTYTDTISISFSSLPIETTDFVSMTNQVLAACQNQANRINYSGTKYFYLVSLSSLLSTPTSANVIIRSVFGTKNNGYGDFTPVGEWPKSVFPNISVAYSDHYTCADLINSQNGNLHQAPYWLETYINKYKSYLNYDPIQAVVYGEPNPNEEIVLGNVLGFFGTSEYIFTNSEHVYNIDNPNFWDSLLHQTNPNDITPADCIKDLNCWKFSNLNSPTEVNRPRDCITSAGSKCLGKADLDYYFDRFMSMILATMNRYNRHTFISIFNFGGTGKCVFSTCSYWWYANILIGDSYKVATKPDDKLIFPNPIN